MPAKALVTSAILLFGIIGAYFVIDAAALHSIPPPKSASLGDNLVAAVPKVEELKKNSSTADTINITSVFAEKIGEKIVNKNPSASGEADLTVPNANSVARQVIVEAAQKFNPSTLEAHVDLKELHIIKDSSDTALAQYVAAFAAVSRNTAHVVNALYSRSSKEMDISTIEEMSAAYEKAAADLRALSVPADASWLHKESIELIATRKNILDKILDYEQDPVASVLASNELGRSDIAFALFDRKFSAFLHEKHITI